MEKSTGTLIQPEAAARALPAQGLFRLALAGVVAIIAGWQLRPFLTWSAAALAEHALISDDAFFYSVLARNFHRYGFLTLDGVMPTNGVQPLWMALHVGLARLLPQADMLELIARASWLAYVLFAALAVWYAARRTGWAAGVAAVVLGGFLLLNARFQLLVMQGLETPLMLLVVMLTLMAIDWISARPAAALRVWQAAALGALAALCFFARTDLFWIAAVVGAWLLLVHRAAWRSVAAYWGTVALLVAPYLLFNLTSQGSLMPISGRVKLFYLELFHPTLTSYVVSDEWRGLFDAFGTLLPLPGVIVYPLALLLLATAVYLVWHLRNRAVFPTGVQLFALVVIGHVGYLYLLYRELRPYSSYYFALELLWVTLVAALLAGWGVALAQDKTARRRRALLTLTGVACVAALGVTAVTWQQLSTQAQDYWRMRVALARDIAEIVPQGERVGAFWPGALAHFSGRGVVPLDGIIGSNEYFEGYVRPGRELDYLAETAVSYLAIFLPYAPATYLAAPDAPPITQWSDLGLLRLWQWRDTPMRALAARTINDAGAGWYLLELDHTAGPPRD